MDVIRPSDIIVYRAIGILGCCKYSVYGLNFIEKYLSILTDTKTLLELNNFTVKFWFT